MDNSWNARMRKVVGRGQPRNPDMVVGTRVNIANLDPIAKQTAGIAQEAVVQGTITGNDPNSGLYVVDVGGHQFIVTPSQLSLTEKLTLLNRVNEQMAADPDRDKSTLASRLKTRPGGATMAKPKTNTTDGTDGEAEVTTDPFDVEIERLMREKVEHISADLVSLKTGWNEVLAQQLGQELSKFIEYALPFLDHLIMLIGVAKSDAELKHAVSSFRELMSMNAEVIDNTQVSAWVEMQLDTIKDII